MSNEVKELLLKITKKAIDKELIVRIQPNVCVEAFNLVNGGYGFYHVVFTGCDDTYEIEKLEEMLKKMREH